MGLIDAENELGREIEAKRKAEQAKKEMVEQAKKEAADEQKRHEENKKQGMI